MELNEGMDSDVEEKGSDMEKGSKGETAANENNTEPGTAAIKTESQGDRDTSDNANPTSSEEESFLQNR